MKKIDYLQTFIADRLDQIEKILVPQKGYATINGVYGSKILVEETATQKVIIYYKNGVLNSTDWSDLLGDN